MTTSALEIVNPVPAEEIPGWVRTMATTFLAEPESEKTGRWVANIARDWQENRAWGARDRGRWVATLRTLDRTLTLPGADGATELLGADALTSVTVAATHRRRGLLTRMLGDSLRAARERGDAVSILISAEWPIYGRFGYAPATFRARQVLHRYRSGSTVAGDLMRVRQVDHDEFAQVAPDAFEAARRRRAGNVDRAQPWWDRHLGRDGWATPGDGLPHNHLVHDGEAGVDGLLTWTATRDPDLGPPFGAARAEMAAATDAAHRDLWAYLSGLDLIDEITIPGPVDEAARWLLPDARTLTTTATEDFLWLRLLDVPAALAARRYAVPGELVLELVDETAVSVAGCYRLTVIAGTPGSDDDIVEAVPTAAAPDLTLAQTALASAYLGGVSLRAQRPAGTVVEHTPGALALADAMFATALAPYNATGF